MSDYKVPFTKIRAINPHPGADRLEIAKVYDFEVVVSKNRYQIGDSVIYVPIDSVLSPQVESIVFPEGSKIKLHKSRVRQIKIRGHISQGLLIDPISVISLVDTSQAKEEQDVSKELGLTKYEPPTPAFQSGAIGSMKVKPFCNPNFRTYNGITNIRWGHPFEGKEVVMQCKLHGSHVRFAKVPFVANTLWKKVLSFFKLTPKFEQVYGSNNVELTNRKGFKGYYGEDIYGKTLARFDAFSKIKDNEIVHAEIIGPGIQKGYSYGHKDHHLVIFDVRIVNADGTQTWLNPEEVESFAKQRGFTFVPVLYTGLFSEEVLKEHTSGPSVYCPAEKIREGCVVKLRHGYDQNGSKQAFKSINPDYLAGDFGDNH